MPDRPPFTITSEMLNLVAEISEQVGRLNARALNASPQLRKQNRIKTITGTLAIEGNTLDHGDCGWQAGAGECARIGRGERRHCRVRCPA